VLTLTAVIWPAVPILPFESLPSYCSNDGRLFDASFTDAIDPLGLAVSVTSQSVIKRLDGSVLGAEELNNDLFFLAQGTYKVSEPINITSLAKQQTFQADARTVMCDPKPLKTFPWDNNVRFVTNKDGVLRVFAVYDESETDVLAGPAELVSKARPPRLTWMKKSNGAVWRTPFALRGSKDFESYQLVLSIEDNFANLFDLNTKATVAQPVSRLDTSLVDAFERVTQVLASVSALEDTLDYEDNTPVKALCDERALDLQRRIKILNAIVESRAGPDVFRRAVCIPTDWIDDLGNWFQWTVTWTGAEQITSTAHSRDHYLAVPVALSRYDF
jgi:hypothetical protein